MEAPFAEPVGRVEPSDVGSKTEDKTFEAHVVRES